MYCPIEDSVNSVYYTPYLNLLSFPLSGGLILVENWAVLNLKVKKKKKTWWRVCRGSALGTENHSLLDCFGNEIEFCLIQATESWYHVFDIIRLFTSSLAFILINTSAQMYTVLNVIKNRTWSLSRMDSRKQLFRIKWLVMAALREYI